jgi:hypothetical protein
LVSVLWIVVVCWYLWYTSVLKLFTLGIFMSLCFGSFSIKQYTAGFFNLSSFQSVSFVCYLVGWFKFFFRGTGAWSQGLHLEPPHQYFFVMCEGLMDNLPRAGFNCCPPDLCLLSLRLQVWATGAQLILFCCCCCFWDRVSLCSPDWPWTCNLPPLPSKCTIMPDSQSLLPIKCSPLGYIMVTDIVGFVSLTFFFRCF